MQSDTRKVTYFEGKRTISVTEGQTTTTYTQDRRAMIGQDAEGNPVRRAVQTGVQMQSTTAPQVSERQICVRILP